MSKKGLLRKGIAAVLSAAMVLGSMWIPAASGGVTTAKAASSYNNTSRRRVSVHDPSIIKDTDGTYYIFGSHMAWAKSTDLENWTTFTNNINRDYRTIFAKEFEWASINDEGYKPAENLWAPDVIWNKEMKKWCMYMSINGNSWNSSIVLLTADSLSGDWTRVGTVVYSGFGTDEHDYKLTDYTEVTGDTSLPSRYVNGTTWNFRYGAHAIDPCVFYDEEGNLRFAYGSWSGGIYTFELDEATGFRDKNVTYPYEAGVSDPYMGKKLGGSTASGEAVYIEHINNYYYMFLSYGGLVANGGYNMRVFRSENPDGPYTDVSGDSALKGGGTNGTIGTRLMSYYKWSYAKNAQVAQGHNSAFVDDDGNAYVVYHTRTNNGTEYHSVRVHQLFTTENDYLVAAPFEYSKTDEVKTTYSTEEIAGGYEILFQNNTNNELLEYNEPKNITLQEDGTITGDVTGTWSETDGTAFVKMTIDNVVYEGTFVNQTIEETDAKALCFTAVGNNDICLWGMKPESEAVSTELAANSISLPTKVSDDIILPTEGNMGTAISWESKSDFILKDGTVIQPAADKTAELVATVSKGDYSVQKTFRLTVTAAVEESTVKLQSYYTDKPLNLGAGETASVANPFYGEDTSNGVTIKFKANRTGDYMYLGNILAFNTVNNAASLDSSNGRMYFTGGSYLGYNAAGGYFDANVKNTDPWGSGTDYIGQNKDTQIEIRLTSSGFSVWADGKEVYNKDSVKDGTTLGALSVTDYSQVLSWLSGTATYLNFGFGSWWTDKFNGTISDVEFYVEREEQKESSNTYYTQDYENATAVSSIWTGGGTISKESGESNYVKIVPSGSGNRGFQSSFGLEKQPEGEYVFETDVMLTSSTGNNGSTTPLSQFVLAGSDLAYQSGGINAGAVSGYILKLEASGLNNQVFTINDSEDTVTIPASTWVHISVAMDSSDLSKAVLSIQNAATGDTLVSDKTITVSGEGALSGIYILCGRGDSSSAALDNTVIKKPNIGDYAELNTVLKKAKKYVKQSEAATIYSEESMNALKAVVEEADAFDPNLGIEKQDEIDAMAAKINTAISSLVCVKHDYSNWSVTKKATCEAEGLETRICYYCGEKESQITARIAHTAGEWVVTKAATTTAAGERVKKCTSCGAVVEKEVIAKLPSSGSGNNGGTTTGTPDTAGTPGTAIKAGSIQTVSGVKYKVLSTKSATVSYKAPKNKKITSATIPATVKISGKKYKVTAIEASAFAKCKKLKKVTIGTNVKTIGKKAFYKCSKLKSIKVKSKKLTKVGSNAFKGIHKKAVIQVPKAKLSKYKKLMKKKGQAKTVKIKK